VWFIGAFGDGGGDAGGVGDVGAFVPSFFTP
jgi:hypothetical protein